MADLLRTGAAWLAGQLKAYASQSVTYRRDVQSVTLSATPAIPRETLDDEGYALVQTDVQEFVFTAADLILGGSVVRPRPGDVIQWVVGSETQTFLLTPDSGEDVWTREDPAGLLIRVRGKRQ